MPSRARVCRRFSTPTASPVAFPLGNLSMVGFIAVFGECCRPLGGPAALAVGYAAALATLVGLEVGRWARAGHAPAAGPAEKPDSGFSPHAGRRSDTIGAY